MLKYELRPTPLSFLCVAKVTDYNSKPGVEKLDALIVRLVQEEVQDGVE